MRAKRTTATVYFIRRMVCFALMAALLLGGALAFGRCSEEPAPAESLDIWGTGAGETAPQLPPEIPATPVEELYSAMWISYLEWESVDFSSEAAFTADVSTIMANTANLGLKTVIVQVRPFGDALYKSSLFPASHLLTGVQGDGVDYDPLTILVNAAHAAGLRIEAWLNPYRVRLNAEKPAVLSADNPAVRWMNDPATAGYVHEVGGGIYYDPGVPEVRALIAEGVREIVENYAVDGVLFDDYFYPTTDPAFDADTYAAYGEGMALSVWRKENVNTLVREVYALIKQLAPACSFGISPAGNIRNNIEQQYSDIYLWLAEPGYVDYLMPQLYWGFDYTMSNGSRAFAFENCLADWAALPRAASVQLYVALGAYRIGDGDGSEATLTEWNCGENLARQVQALRQSAGGFSLYRYDFLYHNAAHDELATREIAALQALLGLHTAP